MIFGQYQANRAAIAQARAAELYEQAQRRRVGSMTPIGLRTNQDISGTVHLNQSWAHLDPVARLDLVQDWLAVLEQLRQVCHRDIYQGKTGDIYEFQTSLMEAITGWENHGGKA